MLVGRSAAFGLFKLLSCCSLPVILRLLLALPMSILSLFTFTIVLSFGDNLNIINVADCGFKSAGLVSPASSLFYARGPLGLKGDQKYAAFSKAFYEGYDRSSELLNEPNRVSSDGYVSFASALWKHMVPEASQPSTHNVMTGFYVPNSSDLSGGHTAGFGSTILIHEKTLCGTATR